jgi:hypothetical protein
MVKYITLLIVLTFVLVLSSSASAQNCDWVANTCVDAYGNPTGNFPWTPGMPWTYGCNAGSYDCFPFLWGAGTVTYFTTALEAAIFLTQAGVFVAIALAYGWVVTHPQEAQAMMAFYMEMYGSICAANPLACSP